MGLFNPIILGHRIDDWASEYSLVAARTLNQVAADLIVSAEQDVSNANLKDGLWAQSAFLQVSIAPKVREVAEPVAIEILNEANAALAAIAEEQAVWVRSPDYAEQPEAVFDGARDIAAAAVPLAAGVATAASLPFAAVTTTTGLLVRPDESAVDHLDVGIRRVGNGVHHPIPDPNLTPSHEAIVAGGARTIAFRQVAPWRAGSQHPEDPVQHTAIINARYATRLVGQERLDHAPLEVGQVISAHADAESEKPPEEKPFRSKAVGLWVGEYGVDRKMRISNFHLLQQRDHLPPILPPDRSIPLIENANMK